MRLIYKNKLPNASTTQLGSYSFSDSYEVYIEDSDAKPIMCNSEKEARDLVKELNGNRESGVNLDTPIYHYRKIKEKRRDYDFEYGYGLGYELGKVNQVELEKISQNEYIRKRKLKGSQIAGFRAGYKDASQGLEKRYSMPTKLIYRKVQGEQEPIYQHQSVPVYPMTTDGKDYDKVFAKSQEDRKITVLAIKKVVKYELFEQEVEAKTNDEGLKKVTSNRDDLLEARSFGPDANKSKETYKKELKQLILSNSVGI